MEHAGRRCQPWRRAGRSSRAELEDIRLPNDWVSANPRSRGAVLSPHWQSCAHSHVRLAALLKQALVEAVVGDLHQAAGKVGRYLGCVVCLACHSTSLRPAD